MIVSVVLTTSPTSLAPSEHREMIEQVIASTQMFPDLRGCDVIIAADGVPSEQEHLADQYRAALQGLVWWANNGAHAQVTVRMLTEWGHQANALRVALEHVTSDLILVMEHDTPLSQEPIEWPEAFATLRNEELDVVRFYPETKVRDEWKHLILGPPVTSPSGLRALWTAQWSQRPHLARADWYRALLTTYFAPESRCYVEEVMQPVVDYWTIGKKAGSGRFKVGIYAPLGDSIQRSEHLDGRRGDAAPSIQRFAYPNGVRPEGAPGLPTGITTRSSNGEETQWTA